MTHHGALTMNGILLTGRSLIDMRLITLCMGERTSLFPDGIVSACCSALTDRVIIRNLADGNKLLGVQRGAANQAAVDIRH